MSILVIDVVSELACYNESQGHHGHIVFKIFCFILTLA